LKLIVSGCSFTSIKGEWFDPTYPKQKTFRNTREKYRVKSWQDYLAEKLDIECITVGKSAIGNRQIIERVVSEIACHDPSDIFVIVSFTEWLRLDGNTGGEAWWVIGKPRYVTNAFLTQLITLQSYLESNNIKHLIVHGTEPINNISAGQSFFSENWTLQHIMEQFLENKLYHQINADNIWGWPFFERIGGKTIQSIVELDHTSHPTERGHRHFAEVILKDVERRMQC